MNIEYKTQKDLPCEDLFALFCAVGWATENTTTKEMFQNFNIGFLNSTFVISAWDGKKLIGCVRALSDLHFRSVILDWAVLPDYQNRGIGIELVNRLMNCCKESEWLVQTDKAKAFYEKIGFTLSKDYFLKVSGKWL